MCICTVKSEIISIVSIVIRQSTFKFLELEPHGIFIKMVILSLEFVHANMCYITKTYAIKLFKFTSFRPHCEENYVKHHELHVYLLHRYKISFYEAKWVFVPLKHKHLLFQCFTHAVVVFIIFILRWQLLCNNNACRTTAVSLQVNTNSVLNNRFRSIGSRLIVLLFLWAYFEYIKSTSGIVSMPQQIYMDDYVT